VNTPETPVGSELDIRSLRYFVAVAEELHFTRAAARLFVAQQALSREIRRLERQLGTELFVRTTRRVSLTADGARLLERARSLVALHDGIWADMRASGVRAVVVDLLSEGRLTGPRILEAARRIAPAVEYRGRYGGGAGGALDRLRAGALDVVLGRLDWLDRTAEPGIERRVVRLEPLAVLLPAEHRLARSPTVPLGALRGVEIDANPADPLALEWADLVRQFLALAGAHPTPPHLPAIGLEEQEEHLVRQGIPILTGVDHVPLPRGVIRPIVDPVPLYPWSMAWRAGTGGEALAALTAAADELAGAPDWLGWEDVLGAGTEGSYWLPLPEATRLVRADLPD